MVPCKPWRPEFNGKAVFLSQFSLHTHSATKKSYYLDNGRASKGATQRICGTLKICDYRI